MTKTTNILALCGVVLVLACGASADEYVELDRHGSMPVPQGSDGIKNET